MPGDPEMLEMRRKIRQEILRRIRAILLRAFLFEIHARAREI